MLFAKHEQKKNIINNHFKDRKQSKLMIDPIILSSITLQVQLLSRIKKGNLASQGLRVITRLLDAEMKRFDQKLSIKHIQGLIVAG